MRSGSLESMTKWIGPKQWIILYLISRLEFADVYGNARIVLSRKVVEQYYGRGSTRIAICRLKQEGWILSESDDTIVPGVEFVAAYM